RIFELLDKKEKRPTNCGGSYTRFAVDAEGNILPCENFIAEPLFYMGNVLTALDISYRKTFKDIRAADSEICRACWARHLCGGWCPFFSFNRYGDLKKPVDDQCRLKKSQFEIGMGVYSLFKKRKKVTAQNQNPEVQNADKP
ncbi:MAG TPA: SPASM domain-containing protein, partial [Candidatus Kapabacteria bacterium]|nr:SPASM domain-containing protein [Candidatus Kapabacteria bacterium]